MIKSVTASSRPVLTIRNAKPLFALTVLLIPWDILQFRQPDTWGVTFVFGRFVRVQSETQLLNPLELLGAYRSLGQSGSVGLLVTGVWGICAGVAFLGALYTIYGRLFVGGTTINEDRAVGVALIGAGSVFFLSRLIVTIGGLLDWNSLPVGALYVVFVGLVFYYDRFRLGAG